ncbi:MAG: RND transporter, partial [Hyphomonas sp.]|nr:RND transporter [Hyphomonas sp.]
MTRTFILLFALVASTAAAIAGPGHDHGGGGAAQATAEIPRIESVTPDIELVATAEGHKLTIYLDAPVTNEPVEGAKIVVEADGKHKAEAKPKGNGVYELEADWVDQPGVKALVFTVTTPTITDLL